MRRTIPGIVAAVAVGACSSGTAQLGQSHAAVDTICSESPAATLDGIPAYAYCGNFNVWSNNGVDTSSTSGGTGWVVTEVGLGYQCTEYAMRYEYFKFGVDTSAWGISNAWEMCNTHPPAIAEVSTPVHGDLMVFAPGSCGADKTTGHVAVVDTVSATTVKVVQEHVAGSASYQRTCASCWLHASSNGGDPCATAPSDRDYCGQSIWWNGGTPNVLYDCQSGATASKTTCAYGCIVKQPGTNDYCAAAPADAGSDAGADAAPPADAAPSEDAAPPAEAAPAPPDAGGDDTNESGGCAVAVPGSASGSGASLAGLLLGALAIRRRRPRRGRSN